MAVHLQLTDDKHIEIGNHGEMNGEPVEQKLTECMKNQMPQY